MTRTYLRWCEHTARPGDCLRLLAESPTVTGDGRYALALAMAQGIVTEELMDAFKDMADPQAMLTTVLWTWTTYMILLAVPEPVSKGLAAVMTATLIAYVGVDTFWNLIVGFKQLVAAANRATTFDELRVEGERYGKLMGRSAARAFAILAMAAIGNTATGLATKVQKFPGAAQAAVQAESQLGIRLVAVGEVEMVAVSAETVTIALAPGAVAMTMRGRQTSSNASESIKSLKARLVEHQQKLADYKGDPDAFDNQGILRNAPSPEVRQRIINGRIKHLEDEIRAFEKAIRDLGGEP
ncbi:hypothetical protein SAMN05443639_11449 [Stigmatella erecta]|uniref:Uncharacterized protein n=1 Tax=Stigmatella erecta TaxID=83460 RepID=A0A1I0KSU2_9BACT|nr:hypothetical protein SAMN05443639_11449 [Stigmatella erecta]